jgi:outer membrane lipoprotein-sorting protein
MQRHPGLRWFVPIVIVGVAAFAVSALADPRHSSRSLPSIAPDALVHSVQAAQSGGYSGTVVANVALGLPSLPVDADALGLGPLLDGSHTMRVSYGGAQKQRVTLLTTSGDTDVFRNGDQVWQWDSSTQVATRSAQPGSTGQPPLSIASMTPDALASIFYPLLGDDSSATASQGADIAGRAVYDLNLSPHAAASRVGSVRIEIDGAERVPLGVQVYARGQAGPAIDVSFTSFTAHQPPADYFQFVPPAGATVRVGTSRGLLGAIEQNGTQMRTAGSGWTTVEELQTTAAGVKAAGYLFRSQMQSVSGAWGQGQLLELPLLCVLTLSDGHIYLGAVDPEVMYSAIVSTPLGH